MPSRPGPTRRNFGAGETRVGFLRAQVAAAGRFADRGWGSHPGVLSEANGRSIVWSYSAQAQLEFYRALNLTS
ncbi:hypothetical protein [Nitrosomonas communis]|uniref:Uncharacterized protein n=1 Tax=Nitrosomonas communis TaxID=44574 RepID=A0A1I4V2C8_9PROT|nr:hypothetical protein [Nitrosomonas communis]SFM95397.1 hypothetical protein SAMN05421863_10755 [Nitrosomonas communis]